MFVEWLDFVSNQYFDKRYVQVSVDGFKTHSNVARLPDSAASSQQKIWATRRIDLSAWAGKKVRIGFAFHQVSRYGNSTLGGAGWFIDKVAIRDKVGCTKAADCGTNDQCGSYACESGLCVLKPIKADGEACGSPYGCNPTTTCSKGRCQNSWLHCDDDTPCTLSYCSGSSCQHLAGSYNANTVCGDGKKCGTTGKCDGSF